MEQQRKTRLEASGINVEGALDRFMGNEAMLERYFKKFPDEKSYIALQAAFAAEDKEAAKVAVHTLKGVCGTIGCDGMHAMVLRQEQLLRSGDWNGALEMMSDIAQIYDKICTALRDEA